MVTSNTPRVLWAIALALFVLTPARALAHCDGLDGPVVKAAQRALETRNPALALIWVQEKDQREIQTAFEQTLAVRELGPAGEGTGRPFLLRDPGPRAPRGRRRPVHGPQSRRAAILGRRFLLRTKPFVSAPSTAFSSCSRAPFKNGFVNSLGRRSRPGHSNPTICLRAGRMSRRTWSSFIS